SRICKHSPITVNFLLTEKPFHSTLPSLLYFSFFRPRQGRLRQNLSPSGSSATVTWITPQGSPDYGRGFNRSLPGACFPPTTSITRAFLQAALKSSSWRTGEGRGAQEAPPFCFLIARACF